MSRRRGRRCGARLLAAAGLTAVAALGPALPALAAGTGTVTVQPAAEAWYRATPACALPTGCVPLPPSPSPYAPGTLHVGVDAGVEEARTYLRLDLRPLTVGTSPTGGTLLLPIADGPTDGTRAPESSALQACAVDEEVMDVDGSSAAPPEADCATASAPARFVAGTAQAPAALTVDLAALAAAWRTGSAPGALALVPADGTAAPDSWHVAFSQRTRTGEGVVPIRAALAFVSSAVDPATQPAPRVPAPDVAPAPAVESALDLGLPASSAVGPPELAAAAEPAPAASSGPAPVTAAGAPQAVVPVASAVQAGFRYPGVFLLPLLLAVAAGWLGRALTRDLAEPQP